MHLLMSEVLPLHGQVLNFFHFLHVLRRWVAFWEVSPCSFTLVTVRLHRLL